MHGWVEVPDVPYRHGPKLGRRPGGDAWPEATKAWWKAVSAMPHCVLWQPSDWAYALDTAWMHAQAVDGARWAAVEQRHRERVLGVTWADRRSQRIRYVNPEPDDAPEDAAVVTAMAKYRRIADEP